MEFLPAGWQDIGSQGLVVLFVLAILLGWLIPRRWHERALADRDSQIDALRQANENLIAALQDLTVTAHTAPIALRSLTREARQGDDS